MKGINDHPLQAHCATCQFAGSDGDFGQVQTCDAMPEQRDSDDVWRQIDRWVRGGEVGPCPAWEPAWWADYIAVAELERSMGLAEAQPAEVSDV